MNDAGKALSASEEERQTVLRGFELYLLVERGLAPSTVTAYRADIERFFSTIEKNYRQVSLSDTVSYITYLMNEEYKPTSVNRVTSSLRIFYRYLVSEDEIDSSPLELLETPKLSERLPDYLFYEDVMKIINNARNDLAKLEAEAAPFRERFRASRDVAAIALLYAAGLRASELAKLKFVDMDFSLKIIRTVGKRLKERLVPFGGQSEILLNNYLKNYRETVNTESPYIFVDYKGNNHISRQTLWYAVKRYAKLAGVEPVKPHLFRHTFATHLIQAGADLRTVQEMLGHSSISTTQIYSHLHVMVLKEIHSRTHPRG